MQPHLESGQITAAPHPLAELLQCPEYVGSMLSGSSRSIGCDAGIEVFRQHDLCKGLYLVVSGSFVRKTERMNTRLTLGSARPGDLVELAAALGVGRHTYTLRALTAGSLLLLPIQALNHSFESYPQLRMRLLEELAREISRGYLACCMSRIDRRRQGSLTAG